MIRLVILLLGVHSSEGSTCSSQADPCFPFQAGPILIYANNNYWYSQYVVLGGYCPQNFDNVAVSVSSILWQASQNSLDYYLNVTLILSTGFSVNSTFNSTSNFKTIQLSFLAYRENFGIELQQASVYTSITNSSNGGTNLTSRLYELTYSSVFNGSTNKSDFTVSVNYMCMSVQFPTNNSLQAVVAVQLNNSKVTITLVSSQDTILSAVCLDILVFRTSTLDTVMLSYNYAYKLSTSYTMTSSLQVAYQSTYTNSNFYAFTGSASMYVTSDFQFGYTIDPNAQVGPWFQQTAGYNLSIVARQAIFSGKFTFFTFKQTSCANQFFPYVNPYNNECCDQCPSGYGAFGFNCRLCSQVDPNCQQCNSSQCITCAPPMTFIVDGLCSLCSATQFYSSSNSSCTQCADVFSNCFSCNQSSCLQCSTTFYYDAGSQSCLPCNVNTLHCVECTAATCTSCESSFYLDPAASMCNSCNQVAADCNQCTTGTCTQCPVGNYLNTSSFDCELCSSVYQFCLQCNFASCLSCDDNQQAYLQGGVCEQCSSGSYLDLPSQSCHPCAQYDVQCTDCSSQACTDCLAPKILAGGICISNQPQVTFQMDVYPSLNSESVLYVFLYLSNLSRLVSQTYSISFKLDGNTKNFSQRNQQSNNTIVCTIPYFDSINSPNVSVKFTNTTSIQVLRKTEDYKVIDSIYVIKDIETIVARYITNITEAFSKHSGSIISGLSLTSTGGYLINALWSVQIIFLYYFIDVAKPKLLTLFLNSTLQLQNIQLLPFPIPDPFENYNPKLNVGQAYSNAEVEPCFVKSNFKSIVSVLMFSLLYLLVFAVIRKIESENCVFRLIRRMYVFKLHANISVSFYNILIPLGFSSAVALISRGSPSWDIVLNYSAGLLGIMFVFAIPVFQTLMVSILKNQQGHEIQDCFLVYKPKRRHSELVLLVYLMSQIVIPVMIPLFHPMQTVPLLILMRVLNIAFMLWIPIVRIRGYVYIRVLLQTAYILFNLVFVILYILEQQFPNASTDILSNVGKGGAFLIVCILLLQGLGTTFEIVAGIYDLFSPLFVKSKFRNLQKSKSIIQKKPTLRREGIILKKYTNNLVNTVRYKEKGSSGKPKSEVVQHRKQGFPTAQYNTGQGLIKAPEFPLGKSRFQVFKPNQLRFRKKHHAQTRLIGELPSHCPAKLKITGSQISDLI